MFSTYVCIIAKVYIFRAFENWVDDLLIALKMIKYFRVFAAGDFWRSYRQLGCWHWTNG